MGPRLANSESISESARDGKELAHDRRLGKLEYQAPRWAHCLGQLQLLG